MTVTAVTFFTFAVAALLGVAIHSSGAVFVAASRNPGNLFVAGSMGLTNSSSNQAVINAIGLAPGASAIGSLVIGTTGNFNEQVTLRGAGDSSALAQALTMTVEYVPTSGPAQTLWTGLLSSFSNLSLGSFAPGTSRTYRFTVTLPANAPVAALNSKTTETLTFTGVAQ